MNRLFGPTRAPFSMPATAAGLLALMLLTVPLRAQNVQLLPPTPRDDQQPRLAPGLGVPGFADPAGQPQMAPPPPPCILLLPAGDARQPSVLEAPRLLQNIKADFTWLMGSGSHAFVVNDIDLYATVPVLFAEPGRKPGQVVGKTPWLQSVYADGPTRLIGRIVETRLTEGHANSLAGEIVVRPYEVAA